MSSISAAPPGGIETGALSATVWRDLPSVADPRALMRPRPVAAAASNKAPHPTESLAQGSQASDPVSFDELRDSAYQEGMRLGREAGYQQGFEEGCAQGRQRGLEQGLAEGREAGEKEVLQRAQAADSAVSQRLERLDQWLSALPEQARAQMASRLEAAEEDMVALCHLALCRILGEQALQDAGVVGAVRQAIEEYAGTSAVPRDVLGGSLAVHVHPADVALLQQDATMARWLERQGGGPIQWVADEGVALGGCRVHGPQGSLDARLETQLALLREALLNIRHEQVSAALAPREALRENGSASDDRP